MSIPDGYTFVAGRDGYRARALLVAAKAVGDKPEVVVAQRGGYLVPTRVADEYQRTSAQPTEAPAEVVYIDGSTPEVGDDGIPVVVELTPTSDWKNADIEQWAKDHGIDLGTATKKADMLAAIEAARNKEE